MLIKDKQSAIITLGFVVLILLLVVNIICKFTILDLSYLLFILGCFIRYIYIKVH